MEKFSFGVILVTQRKRYHSVPNILIQLGAPGEGCHVSDLKADGDVGEAWVTVSWGLTTMWVVSQAFVFLHVEVWVQAP